MRRFLWTLLIFVTAPGLLRAERLPLKTYTTADGLAHNVVDKIVRDSRGFLWFCTREGLSRFDGYGFVSYGVEQGLPGARISDLLETRAGAYWIASRAGVVRFDPRGTARAPTSAVGHAAADAMFTTLPVAGTARASAATVLREDRAGTVWLGTEGGLYRFDEAGGVGQFVWVELGIPDQLDARVITSLIEDSAGSLWIGTANGLYRRPVHGAVERYSIADGLPDSYINSLFIDRAGRFWIGTRSGGLACTTFDATTNHLVVSRVYAEADRLRSPWINEIFESADGDIWVGSAIGLLRLVDSPDVPGSHLQIYATVRHGLIRGEVQSMAEDISGNLWMSTPHGGVARLWKHGFTAFEAADGAAGVRDLIAIRSGELAILGIQHADNVWYRYSLGTNGLTSAPLHAAGPPTWAWHQQAVRDCLGDWWFATRNGAARDASTASPSGRPTTVYTTRDGLASDVVLRLFEDSRGDMWIATVGEGRGPSGVSRWERRTNTFHHYSERDGLPSGERFYASAFAEDRTGSIWIGFSADGGLARYRGGHFTHFPADRGAPLGRINDLLLDASGRLWVASLRGGVGRVDAPEADALTLRAYTTAHGLSSNEVTTVIDDAFGRIYATTGQGVDRIDPRTDQVRRFGLREGMPIGEVNVAARDAQGALWFLTSSLVRFVPEPEPAAHAPNVVITRLSIGGRAQPVSILGDIALPALEIGPDPGTLEVDFLALGFEPGEWLRYSHKLEGVEDQWSDLTNQRRATYAGLGAGTYRFLVRAVNADGVASEVPASFSLRVRPPVWRRWWFISLAALAIALVLTTAHRYRVARLVEIEQVRTRIATDLHDDIGANLTTIAVLSEVAQQGGPLGTNGPLTSIASVARDSIASMADIVWAINPERDRVTHLVRRMRAHVEEVCAARGLAVTFSAPDGADDKLDVHVRRDLFLIFKEAVNNAGRHAGGRSMRIELRLERRVLVLEVIDDGIGFDLAADTDGNGLGGMRRRAQRLGARFDLVSAAGAGTTVRVVLPLPQSFARRVRAYRRR